MNSRLSALLDGELEQDEVLALCDALRKKRERVDLAEDARLYSLIGASLRGEAVTATNLTARIMTALEQEPVVLAPRRSPLARWQRPALALAASVAGVAVVAAVVLAPLDGKVGQVIPALAQGETLLRHPPVLAVADMQEYLIAHQAHAMGATLGAGSQQIRTVSMVDQGTVK